MTSDSSSVFATHGILKKRKKQVLLSEALVFLLFSACLIFQFGVKTAQAEESVNAEERLQRMEQEIELLKQQNKELHEQLQKLGEKMGGPASPSAGETPDQSESSEAPTTRQREPENTGARLSIDPGHGVQLESEDGRHKFRVGGRIKARFEAYDSGHPSNSEFSMNSARLNAKVKMFDHYQLKIQTEFANSVKLKDAYVDIDYDSIPGVRVGQFTMPFSYESLSSSKYNDFPERSMGVKNMRDPSRDIGIMLSDDVCGDYAEYQIALVNGSGDNTGETNDSKDVVGRLVFKPFAEVEDARFSKLHLGVSGTWGDQDSNYANTSFKTVAGTKFTTFSGGTEHRGARSRLGTELVWPIGPASMKTELIQMCLDDFHMGATEEDLSFYSWYLSGSYLLTGETKTLKRIVPKRPFDPSKNMWGAWEFATRYSLFRGDRDLFSSGMATGTDKAESMTVGLNWYLNELMKVSFMYERTEFDDSIVVGDETLDDEDFFLVQYQFEF